MDEHDLWNYAGAENAVSPLGNQLSVPCLDLQGGGVILLPNVLVFDVMNEVRFAGDGRRMWNLNCVVASSFHFHFGVREFVRLNPTLKHVLT